MSTPEQPSLIRRASDFLQNPAMRISTSFAKAASWGAAAGATFIVLNKVTGSEPGDTNGLIFVAGGVVGVVTSFAQDIKALRQRRKNPLAASSDDISGMHPE